MNCETCSQFWKGIGDFFAYPLTNEIDVKDIVLITILVFIVWTISYDFHVMLKDSI